VSRPQVLPRTAPAFVTPPSACPSDGVSVLSRAGVRGHWWPRDGQKGAGIHGQRIAERGTFDPSMCPPRCLAPRCYPGRPPLSSPRLARTITALGSTRELARRPCFQVPLPVKSGPPGVPRAHGVGRRTLRLLAPRRSPSPCRTAFTAASFTHVARGRRRKCKNTVLLVLLQGPQCSQGVRGFPRT